ncbi:MAG: hypothetical protein A3Q59_04115 [Methanomethylophilus alvi]|nr:MAG: hypothetical protein A3Q59_04115 [Methanomethylophilus alvi]
MFSERMVNGKTRIVADISDSNLLRLRVLQLFDQKECTFSEYLDAFLDRAIENYVNYFFDDGYNLYDPKAALLNELLSEKASFCNYAGISVELEPEDAEPLIHDLETAAFERDRQRISESRKKRVFPAFSQPINIPKQIPKLTFP